MTVLDDLNNGPVTVSGPPKVLVQDRGGFLSFDTLADAHDWAVTRIGGVTMIDSSEPGLVRASGPEGTVTIYPR